MKIKLYAYWRKMNWDSEFKISVSNCALETNQYGTYVQAGEFEVDMDVKPLDHAKEIAVQVAALRKEAGHHQAALTQIDARINELLCIEHKAEA